MALGIDWTRYADSPALVSTEAKRTWTYGEVQTEIQWFGRLFDDAKKSLIFSFCRNDGASLIAYLAAVELGQAIAMLDGSLASPLKSNMIARYRPDWIFESAAAPEHEQAIPEELLSSRTYELAATSPSGMRLFKYSGQSESSSAIYPALTLLLPTSGTTGSPKLVRLSAGNLQSNALSIQEYLQIDRDERPILCLPIHYSYGISVVNSHFLSGACIVVPSETILQPQFWECCRSECCTSFAGVPYTYQILERIGFEKRIPSDIRTMTQAGGKLEQRLISKFDGFMKDRNGRFFVMYGQTEATARMSYLPPDRLPEKLGSVGISIPGGKFWIEKDGRRVTEPMDIGEVVYSGNNVMLGYAETRADLSRGDESLKILHTGDLGYFDADGFLFITGRNKRIVKLYGHRINLDEVEKKVQEHSSILGPVAVVGASESLIVYCERGQSSDFDTLRTGLSELYRLNANTFQFKNIGKLPLTSSGKINYQLLQSA
jgi:long-chain acyl-CoA synthetase